jgi:hypothetical protein
MAELFARHEVNRASIWPRLSKIVLGSLVFHILLGLAMKYVPVARSILGIAGNASDVAFVDEDYQRTIIQDQVVLLTLREGKFKYPDGFFQESFAAAPAPLPQILPASTPPVVPLPKPLAPPPVAQLPTVNQPPDAKTDGALPALDKNNQIAKNQPTPTPKPTATPTPAPPTTAEEAEALIAKTTEETKIPRPRRDEINRRPIKDAFKRINEFQAQGPLNLEGNVEAVYTAERTPENRLANIRILSKQGDESMLKVISELVSAFGDSGAVKFLPESKNYRVAFSFNGPTVKAVIHVETESLDIAKEQANAYGLLLLGARVKQKGQPEEVFLKNAKVAANGKDIVFTCTVPRKATNDLIAQNLAENATAPNTAPTQTP